MLQTSHLGDDHLLFPYLPEEETHPSARTWLWEGETTEREPLFPDCEGDRCLGGRSVLENVKMAIFMKK